MLDGSKNKEKKNRNKITIVSSDIESTQRINKIERDRESCTLYRLNLINTFAHSHQTNYVYISLIQF